MLRPICRSSRPFAKGPGLRARTRSAYTSMPSGSVFTPVAPSRAVARRVSPNRSRMASPEEFVAILETSVSLPFAGQALPPPGVRSASRTRRRGIPLLAPLAPRASDRRTGLVRLVQLDTRLLGLLLRKVLPLSRRRLSRAKARRDEYPRCQRGVLRGRTLTGTRHTRRKRIGKPHCITVIPNFATLSKFQLRQKRIQPGM